MSYSIYVDTDRLLRVFGDSPLSHRTIRRRLGNPKRAVVTAVVSRAVQRGDLRRVLPEEVGSAKHSVGVFALTPE